MKIPYNDWKRYVERLGRINKTAAVTMQYWMEKNPGADAEQLVEIAHAVAEKYGEAAASLACEMYDAIAAAQKANVKPAEPAEPASYGETAKAVYGTLKNKQNTVPATVGRLVKQTGADTMLQNAARDRAQFAWVPMGDTCAFCMMLASRGWQYQSKKAMKNGHAEHIHANCDCEYCIRFDGKSTVEGYDPDRYLEMYENAEGDTWQEKVNAMRREMAAEKRAELETAGEKKIGLPGNENGGIVKAGMPNYAKAIDSLVLVDDVSDHKYTPEQIQEEMQKSEVGRETLRQIEESEPVISIIDEIQNHSDRGNQKGRFINIYSANNHSLLNESQAVIHEMTHFWYNIGGCQHAEAICLARELMHSRNKTVLTKDEWEMIVNLVKEAYPEYEWENGGYGDFSQFDFVT